MLQCKICGAGLTGTQKSICSLECRAVSARLRYLATYEKVTRPDGKCLCCGRAFPASRNKKYCSPACWRKVNDKGRNYKPERAELNKKEPEKPRKQYIKCREAIDSGFY